MIPHLVTEGTHCAATLVYVCIKSYMLTKHSANYTTKEYGDAQDELIGGILALGENYTYSEGEFNISIIYFSVFAVVEIYFWLCVFSLYNQLQDEQTLQQNPNSGPVPRHVPYYPICEI